MKRLGRNAILEGLQNYFEKQPEIMGIYDILFRDETAERGSGRKTKWKLGEANIVQGKNQPNGSEGVKTLHSRPRQAFFANFLLNVARSHVNGQCYIHAKKRSGIGKQGRLLRLTITRNMGIGIRLWDVSSLFANDQTKFNFVEFFKSASWWCSRGRLCMVYLRDGL